MPKPEGIGSALTGREDLLTMRVLILCALALVASCVAGAEEVQWIRARCPVCDDKFKYRLVMQELRSGLRLDFKQFGNPHSPTALADCKKCGFVIPDGGRDGLDRDQSAVLKEMVRSDRFKAAEDETSYFRLALALEALGRPPEDIAFAYLAASWQVDDEPIRCQVYLARSLSWYDMFLDRPEPATPARVRAMLLKAEIMRRLGRFAEAGEYLADLAYHPAVASQAHQNIIQQQKDLVDARDDEPHLAVADDASVALSVRVVTPGSRALTPKLAPDSRLPAFPSGPYAARVAGAVTIELSVTRSGYVVGWQIRSSTASAFSSSVLRSIRDWTFDPERLDGAPSPVQIECTVYFDLEG